MKMISRTRKKPEQLSVTQQTQCPVGVSTEQDIDTNRICFTSSANYVPIQNAALVALWQVKYDNDLQTKGRRRLVSSKLECATSGVRTAAGPRNLFIKPVT